MMIMIMMAALHGFHGRVLLLDAGQPFFIIGAAARCVSFPVGLQSGYTRVAFVAGVAYKRFAAVMYVRMKFHMNPELKEFYLVNCTQKLLN